VTKGGAEKVTEVEQTEPTVEERLETAESRIVALNRDLKALWIFVVSLVGAGVVVIAASEFLPEPQPSNRDATEQELLSNGVHCYDSSEERAAARQRALASIERMKWQQDQLVDQSREASMPMVPVLPPSLSIPWVVDTPSPSSPESWDRARCFSVVYMR
jgi:hypothetical protein